MSSVRASLSARRSPLFVYFRNRSAKRDILDATHEIESGESSDTPLPPVIFRLPSLKLPFAQFSRSRRTEQAFEFEVSKELPRDSGGPQADGVEALGHQGLQGFVMPTSLIDDIAKIVSQ